MRMTALPLVFILPVLGGLAAQTSPPLFVEAVRGHLPSHQDDTRTLVPADLNGDGFPDLVVGNLHRPSECDRVYLGDGSGAFTEAAVSPLKTDGETKKAILAGDLDGDGDVDLVAVGGKKVDTPWIRLFMNDGQGGFTEAVGPTGPPGTEYRSGVLGDLDGDGDLDMVLARMGEADLYLNTGPGVFVYRQVLKGLYGFYPRDVTLGDVDGDKDLDLVGVQPSTSKVQVWFNDGKALFTAPASGLLDVGAAVETLLLADLNRDGNLDLFAGTGRSYTNGQDVIFLGDGKGGFARPTTPLLPTAKDRTSCVAAGDVDGDGRVDLLLGRAHDGNVNHPATTLLLGSVTGGFKRAKGWTYAGYPAVHDVRLVDLDKDGDLDAVLAGPNRLLFNDGKGHFIPTETSQAPDTKVEVDQIQLADLDGDGDLDVVAIGSRNGNHVLYLNRGHGELEDVTATHLATLPSLYPRTLAVGDMDRDGDPDLVVVAQSTMPVAADLLLLPNDGKARFGKPVTILKVSLAEHGWSLATGDVDGDGNRDLCLGCTGQSRLLLGDGQGGFTEVTATHLPPWYTSTRALLLLDVDRDGDLDLVLGNTTDQNRIFLNDGKGRFTNPVPCLLPPRYDETSGLAAGDFNGDGYPDLVTVNGDAKADANRVYLHGGKGKPYGAPLTLPGPATTRGRVALADLDGDGDLDLVESLAEGLRLHLGDGKGGFILYPWSLPLRGCRGVAVGDMDGDGDADLVLCIGTTIRLFGNTTRHLHSPRVVRPGDTLRLVGYGSDPTGRSGRAILPLVGLAPAEMHLPPWGVFRLDETRPLFPLPRLVTAPATGSVRWLLPLPRTAALVGASLYFQAWVQDGGGGWRFTNLTVQRICNF